MLLISNQNLENICLEKDKQFFYIVERSLSRKSEAAGFVLGS